MPGVMRYPDGGGLDRGGTGSPGEGAAGGGGADRGRGQRSGIAKRFRVSRTSANRWRRALAAGGRAALASKGAGGAKCKFTGAQLGELEEVLDAGPAACGYADQRWTRPGSAEQVWQRFGVEYTLAGMDVLLHRIGWSAQVPARRAAERDEERIAAWREEAGGGKRTAADLGAWLGLRGRIRLGPKAAAKERPHPGGDGDRRQRQAGVAGRADRRRAWPSAPVVVGGL